MRRLKTAEERIEKYVASASEDDCWPWLGATTRGGYGEMVRDDGKIGYAHRVSFELASGEKLTKKDTVRHSCDNRPCCNPKHLIRGSQKENLQDMFLKKRNKNVRGESCGSSKLTNKSVLEIRKLLEEGLTQRAIARIYSVSSSRISDIKNKKSWTHV